MFINVQRNDDGSFSDRFLKVLIENMKINESENWSEEELDKKVAGTINKMKKMFPNRPPVFWEGMLEGSISTASWTQSSVLRGGPDDDIRYMQIQHACMAQLVLDQRKELDKLRQLEEEK